MLRQLPSSERPEMPGRPAMTGPATKTGANAGAVALAIALFGILAMSGWYAAKAWTSIAGPPMPAGGYVAMIMGVIFSVALGCGLMALVFYSSRHGYDERASQDQHLADDADPGPLSSTILPGRGSHAYQSEPSDSRKEE